MIAVPTDKIGLEGVILPKNITLRPPNANANINANANAKHNVRFDRPDQKTINTGTHSPV